MLPFFEKIIENRVDKRINDIIRSDDTLVFRAVSDEEAREEISSFIIHKKSEGITRLSVLDFVLNLKLPADQVEGVLEEFEQKGRLTESYA